MTLTSMPSETADNFTCATPVWVQAEEGPLAVAFGAVQTYHGHAALAMLALTYQGLGGALQQLQAFNHGQPLARSELQVLSGHAGPGVRDAFECVTRAVTRGCYEVDTSLPWARYSLAGNQSYSFVLRWREHEVLAVLREGVLPPQFFALLASRDAADKQAFTQLRRTLAHTFLAQSPAALYTYVHQPAQPA